MPSVRPFGTTALGVVAHLPPIPGVTPGTAQPRALWHNTFGVALIYPRKPQKPQQMPVFIVWNACCPFWPCGRTIRLSAMNSVGSRRKAWGWCRSLCRCRGVCGYGFCNGGGSQGNVERVFCHSRREKGGCGKIMRKTTTASASSGESMNQNPLVMVARWKRATVHNL